MTPVDARSLVSAVGRRRGREVQVTFDSATCSLLVRLRCARELALVRRTGQPTSESGKQSSPEEAGPLEVCPGHSRQEDGPFGEGTK